MEISRHRKKLFAIGSLLTLAFLFRLGFGLSSDFWNEDEKQIYLIGLKFYTTGMWPYFGPDVTNTIQIPGALQGLMGGLPFYVLPVPEAPYVLLNLLSFASLCFFAWYCARRLPELPKWFVWAWLLTAPWTLNLSTHVLNPSYVLAGGILFFVGAIETYPFLTAKIVPLRWANVMMGAALLWVMQFHMSWVVLLPYVLVSFYYQHKTSGNKILVSLAWFFCGAMLTGIFLLPTYAQYGLTNGAGSTNEVVQFNQRNLIRHLNVVEGVLGRFLSFASFELARFIGGNTQARLAFIRRQIWLAPFIVFLGTVGILQPIALLVLWFKKKDETQHWRAIKYFTLATVCLLYVGFVFSFREPHSHTFYVTFPVAMLYSLYCWNGFLKDRRWRIFAAVFLVCGIIFHTGLAIDNFQRKSLYVDRQLPATALDSKDYRVLGERRVGSRY